MFVVEPVSLVIGKFSLIGTGSLRRFGHVKHKGADDGRIK